MMSQLSTLNYDDPMDDHILQMAWNHQPDILRLDDDPGFNEQFDGGEKVFMDIYIYMDMYNTIIYIYPKNLPYGYHGWHIWLSYDDPHSDVTSFHDVMWSGLGLVLSQNGRTIILDWCILIEPDIQLMLRLLIIKVYSYQYTVSNGFCYD